jgi:hypothetical protein
MSEELECPSCSGKGQNMAHINTGEDSSKHTVRPVTCGRCAGTGKVTQEQLDLQAKAKALGRAWYDKQLHNCGGNMMMDVARFWGLKASDISSIRQGRASPPTQDIRKAMIGPMDALSKFLNRWVELSDTIHLTFFYLNHRGERKQYTVEPIAVWHGTTLYHPQPCTMLAGTVVDRNVRRDFDVTKIDLDTVQRDWQQSVVGSSSLGVLG